MENLLLHGKKCMWQMVRSGSILSPPDVKRTMHGHTQNQGSLVGQDPNRLKKKGVISQCKDFV